MNDTVKVRGTLEALGSAFKTGSIIFMVLTILETLAEIILTIVCAIIRKPMEMIFGSLITGKNQPVSKCTSDGTLDYYMKNELPKLPAGEQLKYKMAIEHAKQIIINTHYKK